MKIRRMLFVMLYGVLGMCKISVGQVQASVDIALVAREDTLGKQIVDINYIASETGFAGFDGYWDRQLITIGWSEECGCKSSAPEPAQDMSIVKDTFGFLGIFSKQTSPVIFSPADIGSVEDGYVYTCLYAEPDKPIMLELESKKGQTVMTLDVPDAWKVLHGDCMKIRKKPFYTKDGQLIPYEFAPILSNAAAKRNVWIGTENLNQEKAVKQK
ncbi:MAG: hypothetical protein AAF738_02780 [Bacteroidota bacterium]